MCERRRAEAAAEGLEVDPRPLVLEVVISPVCDRCHLPAYLDESGRWRHASAADAVFCSLVMQGPHPRGRHA
jgi:hypothetical protein